MSKKLLFLSASLLLLAGGGYFFWQKFKYKIIKNTVDSTVTQQTDSLYSIKYDSLHFDEANGDAFLKNVRITVDTNRLKRMAVENLPDLILNATIKSVTVTGVKTAEALHGNKIQGDSVIIDDPQIFIYSLKPLQRNTIFQNEAKTLYQQILGKLDFIKVRFVFINNLNAKSIDFYSKEKRFDFFNGKILLEDVLIDSAHNLDTNRILFCKQAAFTVDSFFSYNHNRRELSVKKVHFMGRQKQLLFDQISVNRFPDDQSEGVRLLDAQKLSLNGVNTNEIVKNKNLVVDTILCNEIILYDLPVENLKISTQKITKSADSTGFMNVYGVYMKHLNFPKVTFVPFAKSNYTLGNISIKVNDVKASQLIDLQMHPMNFTKEAEVSLASFSTASKDGSYHFYFKSISLNSLTKELKIGSFNVNPFGSESIFADKFHYQRDRFDITFKAVSLKNISMNGLLDKQLVASDLLIGNANAKIYRDLHKPLEKKSRAGNYLSQLLLKINLPLDISNATISNAFIQYRENETVSDSVGVVTFVNSKLNVSHITNIPSAIQKNNQLNISFDTKVLGEIPLTGNFKFSMNSSHGDFAANGHTTGFDALLLNKVSIPMTLIKINSGKINSIDFDFNGNNTSAQGDFVMKYNDLKVDVLKRDKITNKVKKRRFISLAANFLVQNNNPGSSGLRKVNAKYERNIYKSFFNLVWKTIFTGMKETVGIP
ncbi:MAG TPA: hypothetical protein VN722_04155 [Hanamia sp.]|nr:hypothetical protein [Hanamia sp.]